MSGIIIVRAAYYLSPEERQCFYAFLYFLQSYAEPFFSACRARPSSSW